MEEAEQLCHCQLLLNTKLIDGNQLQPPVPDFISERQLLQIYVDSLVPARSMMRTDALINPLSEEDCKKDDTETLFIAYDGDDSDEEIDYECNSKMPTFRAKIETLAS